MSVTVETLENLERKVVLSLPWSEINAETDKKLNAVQESTVSVRVKHL